VRTSIVKRLLLFGAVVAALMCVAPQHVSAASGATSRFQPAVLATVVIRPKNSCG